MSTLAGKQPFDDVDASAEHVVINTGLRQHVDATGGPCEQSMLLEYGLTMLTWQC